MRRSFFEFTDAGNESLKSSLCIVEAWRIRRDGCSWFHDIGYFYPLDPLLLLSFVAAAANAISVATALAVLHFATISNAMAADAQFIVLLLAAASDDRVVANWISQLRTVIDADDRVGVNHRLAVRVNSFNH